MSQLTDRAQKPYPEDLVGPDELPDQAPVEHPTPWREAQAGNGHTYLYDANNVLVAHVYLWDKTEIDLFQEKLARINGTQNT